MEQVKICISLPVYFTSVNASRIHEIKSEIPLEMGKSIKSALMEESLNFLLLKKLLFLNPNSMWNSKATD